jgi:hypothetical protein
MNSSHSEVNPQISTRQANCALSRRNLGKVLPHVMLAKSFFLKP